MIIAFDLDEVICTRPKGHEDMGVGKYAYCEPIKDMVKIVNSAYDEGYIIKIYTARGMSVFRGDPYKVYANLYQITCDQLKEWGVKFHELVMGKLHYDLLIDDRAIFSGEIASLDNINKKLQHEVL